MKLKDLQSNYTTTEQSKQLLELGVPEDSADLVIESGCDVKKTIPSWTVFTAWCQNRRTYQVDYEKFMPCWSVGRLIEIMKICNHPDDVDQVFCELAYSKKNLVELIVRLMEENKEITDFSKLEAV